jgi:hypothetical protein
MLLLLNATNYIIFLPYFHFLLSSNYSTLSHTEYFIKTKLEQNITRTQSKTNHPKMQSPVLYDKKGEDKPYKVNELVT